MLPRRILVSSLKAFAIVCVLATGWCINAPMEAKAASNISCRSGLTTERRKEIAQKLRVITGWTDLDFDSFGRLVTGRAESAVSSITARKLIGALLESNHRIILEESNERPDVAFAQVSVADLKLTENEPPVHVNIVTIDFADFRHLHGHPQAIASFDVAWVLLHEFDHILNNSADGMTVEDPGECEAHINRMREECKLPTRTRYFYTSLPLTTQTSFATNWVRLAFDEIESPGIRRRYWLVWDANLVGGATYSTQLASVSYR